jgi:hypothetical protein
MEYKSYIRLIFGDILNSDNSHQALIVNLEMKKFNELEQTTNSFISEIK